MSNFDSEIDKDVTRRYWEAATPDVDGMLGGFPQLHKADIIASRAFLAKLGIGRKPGLRKVGAALEGGAGIGRITKELLLEICETVDVIEPNVTFTDQGLKGEESVRHIFNVGMEEWNPPDGVTYDLVWNQWCLGYLTEKQLTAYLSRCRNVLSPGGLIVAKDNVSNKDFDLFDEQDGMVTRTDAKYRQIFEDAGLRVVSTQMQRNASKGVLSGLLPIWMYALKPKTALVSTMDGESNSSKTS